MVRGLFGDRLGLVIFLGALVFFGTYWRAGFFINDNYTIANALAAVADGHLYVDSILYGPASGDTPGMKIHEGRLYGRNYGLVFAGLPFLVAWKAVLVVADFRIAIVGLWSLLVLALFVQVGIVLEQRSEAAIAGSVVALLAFVGNLAFWTPLSERWVYLVALQSMSMVAAAFVGVLTYRLLARIHDRRVGAIAGALVVVATPIGFWASIPKRHVVIAALVMATLYCFYRSRRGSIRFRALAYVWVALAAWVFPAEGALLLAVLLPLDLLTAPDNAPRTLATVGFVFLLALVPFFATNVAITGNPLEPPHFLRNYRALTPVSEVTDSTVNGPAGSGHGNVEAADFVSRIFGVVTAALGVGPERLSLLQSALTRGVAAATDPTRLYHVFVRSGYIESIAEPGTNGAINLSLLESMPLAALVLAGPLLAVRRGWSGVKSWAGTPAGQTDVFALAFAVVVTLAYLPFLPLHAMITVRYLLPAMPMLLYLGFRLPAVRRTCAAAGRSVLASTVGGVVVFGAGFLALDLTLHPVLGESLQAHAILNLGLASALGLWAVLATWRARGERPGAVLLGLAAAATTVFAVFSSTIYFGDIGPVVLPAVDVLAGVLASTPVRAI